MSYTEIQPVTFNELVGEEIVDLIFTKAPTKVLSRVVNAIMHVEKAKNLKILTPKWPQSGLLQPKKNW